MGIIRGARVGPGDGHSSGFVVRDVVIPSADILTLNASVYTLIPTPGSGKVLIFEGALAYKPSGTAYAGVAGGEDLDIRYTNASGHKVAELELTGFASVATSQRRWVGAYRDDSRHVVLHAGDQQGHSGSH